MLFHYTLSWAVQYSSRCHTVGPVVCRCSVAQLCPAPCDPTDYSPQASLSSTVSWSLLKLRSIASLMLPLLIHPIYNTYSLPLLIPYSQSQISHFPVLSPRDLHPFSSPSSKLPPWFYFIGLYSYFFQDWPYERIQCSSTSYTVPTALQFLPKIKVSRKVRETANCGELKNLKEPHHPESTQSWPDCLS